MARKSDSMLWVLLGLGALAAFLIRQKAAAGTTPPGAAGNTPPAQLGPVAVTAQYVAGNTSSSAAVPLDTTGASALVAPVTSQTLSAGASFWSQLQGVSGPGSGWVLFPSGSQAPAAQLPWAMDSVGTYFTQWGGLVYQVGAMDQDGNYPAVAVG